MSDLEQEARAMGWKPQGEFKGESDKFMDAETYLNHGKTVMPILRRTNEKLHAELTELRQRFDSASGQFAAAQESIEALKKYHSEDKERAVKAAKAQLAKELKEARESGDTAREIEIMGELDDLKAAAKPVEPAKPVAPPPAAVPADIEAWGRENPWYGQDAEKTNMMNLLATQFRARGDKRTGRVFIEAVKEEMDAFLAEREGRRPSKVAESGGGAGGKGGGKSRDFSSLPPEVKSHVHSQAERLVGPGRAFKDMKEWETYFAANYDWSE